MCHHHHKFEFSKAYFRKLLPHMMAFGCLILTFIGWLVLVVGFGIGTVQKGYPTTGVTLTYPFWAAIIGGIVAIIALIIHILTPQPIRSFVGAISMLLGIFFAANLGIILYHTGIIINKVEGFFPNLDVFQFTYINLEFAGSLIAIVFLACTMMLGSFYDISLGVFSKNGDAA